LKFCGMTDGLEYLNGMTFAADCAFDTGFLEKT